MEAVTAKEFLDAKCLSQSNLKVEKDGSASVVEVPLASSPPSIPSRVGKSSTVVLVSESMFLEFVEEMRANHK